MASRSDLQALAAGNGPQAESARERLANGDFQTGDRIAMVVQGEPSLSDTLTVRANQVVHLANMPDITLHGVLRSELQDYLKQQLGQYLRNPDVRAVSLVRVDVLGPVLRPGFYTAPADELVSDVVMQAGGLSPQADINRTVVRRGEVLVQPALRVQEALARGETLDQLDVRAGDAIVVGERPAGGNFPPRSGSCGRRRGHRGERRPDHSPLAQTRRLPPPHGPLQRPFPAIRPGPP